MAVKNAVAAEAGEQEHRPLSDKDFKRALTEVAPHLRAFARGLCGCRDRADDLAQEALLRAWAARDRYRAGTNFKAWTFTILRNHFYSEARRARFHDDYDEAMAERTLRAPNETRTRAARELGLSRATLINKLPEYQLDPNAFAHASHDV